MIDEQFIDKSISELCKNYDIIKGWNVNLCRASADYIDGLKQVARRLLYIMFLKDNGKSFRKVAAITGDTIARIHMHGPSSVYNCLVGLAQSWNNNIPLIEGYGNFGSVAGDPAGADRYIQARLSEYAYDCFFSDWKEAAVDMIMGADGETPEPLYLPAKYPNVLLNGIQGIGYGMATSLPSYNFKEIIKATITLIQNSEAEIVLIPDSPTGCDIIKTNFKQITNTGIGNYLMRAKYKINEDLNEVVITALPYQVSVNSVREKIADLKEEGKLAELIAMHDMSGSKVELHLVTKPHINLLKFIKKMIKLVKGLECTYGVNVSVVNDYNMYELSIKDVLLEWIRYRKEQKRVVISNKRTNLLLEQRINDIKLFIMSGDNLERTLSIFKNGRNKKDIENKLLETYSKSSIRMDSLQAQALSEMKMYELSKESLEKCFKKKTELEKQIAEIEKILNEEDGISKIIIEELMTGVKKYGTSRKSSVIDYEIQTTFETDSKCVLQISSDGMILRSAVSNAEHEPVPTDSNGFAVLVDNESQFVVINENGFYLPLRVKDIKLDKEVPLKHYMKTSFSNIIGVIPLNEGVDACLLISAQGVIRKIRIDTFKNNGNFCIKLGEKDKLIKALPVGVETEKDILIYTKEGFGQRLDPNKFQVGRASSSSKGQKEILLEPNDEVVGCFLFSQKENQYLLYVTATGKLRLNLMKYLMPRNSKKDQLVQLIPLSQQDKLVSISGCNTCDKVQVFYNDGTNEIFEIGKLEESTMRAEPIRVLTKKGWFRVVKVKII